MVGDDWQQDVLGARAVGLGAVWVAPRPEPNRRALVDGTPVIDRFADLPSVLGVEEHRSDGWAECAAGSTD
jgi:FMN phosphatase YigB (HAD superfamily)